MRATRTTKVTRATDGSEDDLFCADLAGGLDVGDIDPGV